MENFILRYTEYIDALRNRHSVQIDLLVDKKVEHLQLSIKMRNDAFWLFKSGLRNTVKTGAENCSIHISFDKPNIVYTLQFDTVNMDMQQLNNLRQRKELLDKLVELNAKHDFKIHKSNAVFVLHIPLKRSGS